jgi:uncharacterized protein YjhX (UPF0386 family)
MRLQSQGEDLTTQNIKLLIARGKLLKMTKNHKNKGFFFRYYEKKKENLSKNIGLKFFKNLKNKVILNSNQGSLFNGLKLFNSEI